MVSGARLVGSGSQRPGDKAPGVGSAADARARAGRRSGLGRRARVESRGGEGRKTRLPSSALSVSLSLLLWPRRQDQAGARARAQGPQRPGTEAASPGEKRATESERASDSLSLSLALDPCSSLCAPVSLGTHTLHHGRRPRTKLEGLRHAPALDQADAAPRGSAARQRLPKMAVEEREEGSVRERCFSHQKASARRGVGGWFGGKKRVRVTSVCCPLGPSLVCGRRGAGGEGEDLRQRQFLSSSSPPTTPAKKISLPRSRDAVDARAFFWMRVDYGV